MQFHKVSLAIKAAIIAGRSFSNTEQAISWQGRSPSTLLHMTMEIIGTVLVE